MHQSHQEQRIKAAADRRKRRAAKPGSSDYAKANANGDMRRKLR